MSRPHETPLQKQRTRELREVVQAVLPAIIAADPGRTIEAHVQEAYEYAMEVLDEHGLWSVGDDDIAAARGLDDALRKLDVFEAMENATLSTEDLLRKVKQPWAAEALRDLGVKK